MKRILVIDDDPAIHDPIKDAIARSFPDAECICEVDFTTGATRAANETPDAVILDLMEGVQSINMPGENTWRSIWNKSFCPIVIYSGSEDEISPAIPTEQRLVARVVKRSGSLDEVVEKLRFFEPFAMAVRSLRTEINAVFHKVLRDTFGAGHFPSEMTDTLVHAGRRRIAASMDEQTVTSGRQMECWEQYLIPALGESPMTADLLRLRESSRDDPASYRLILTPSCDLVTGRCEPTLIAAICEGTERLVAKLSLSTKTGKQADNSKKVSSMLSAGSCAGLLPLPRFASLIPLLVADLKNIDRIPWEDVGPGNSTTHRFLRIASIDSPFREQVSWTYITTAARPGMPDRDFSSWIAELLSKVTEPGPIPE